MRESISELRERAKAGDAEAIQKIKALAEAAREAHERDLNDPVHQMIAARLLQSDIVNDPVWGAIFELPEQEVYEAVRARVTHPGGNYRPTEEDRQFLEMMKNRLTGANMGDDRGNVSRERPKPDKRAERITQVEKLTGHYTIEQIAETLDCSDITVWRIQRDLGLTTPHKRQGGQKPMKKK